MGEKPWLLSGLCWLVYVSFKVSVWLFFSRMRSKGFSFYFGGLGVVNCLLVVSAVFLSSHRPGVHGETEKR